MRAKKEAWPKPKLQIGDWKEGEYDNLTSTSVQERKLRCSLCGIPCTKAWDTAIAGGRRSYCSGGCLYKWLEKRVGQKEAEAQLDMLREVFDLEYLGAVTEEQLKKDMHEQKIQMRKEFVGLDALKLAYREKYGIWPV